MTHTRIQMATQGFIYKLILWKLASWKQPIIAEDEIKVSVIRANKCMVKANNFIISVLFYGNLLTFTISFFILFEYYFKASKEQLTINKI